MASRIVAAALGNILLPLVEKILPSERCECTVCDWKGRSFRNFLSADEVIPSCICPGCGSFDRHRLLVLGVREELAKRPGWNPEVMVGFSLSTAMRYVLEHEGLARCYRSDIVTNDKRFSPDFVADLRQTPVVDNSVDWIFCSHVLDHIAELDECVDEILRVLKPGGLAWIQVPFEPGLAHSRRIEIDPHRAHAWQFAPDFCGLIEREGWKITEIIAGESISAGDRERYGIDPLERFWLARKND